MLRLFNSPLVALRLFGLHPWKRLTYNGTLIMEILSIRLEQSTIATALEQHLLHQKLHAFRLDGDNIRFGLNKVGLTLIFWTFSTLTRPLTSLPLHSRFFFFKFTSFSAGPRVLPHRPYRKHPSNLPRLPPLFPLHLHHHHCIHLSLHIRSRIS